MYPHVVCIYTTSLRVVSNQEQDVLYSQQKNKSTIMYKSRQITCTPHFTWNSRNRSVFRQGAFPNREFQLPCVCLSMWNHLSATRALESFSPRCASSSSSSSSELWPCQTVTAVDIYCFFGLCQKQYPT